MRDTLSSAATVLAVVALMLATKTLTLRPGQQDAQSVLVESLSMPDRGSGAKAATPN